MLTQIAGHDETVTAVVAAAGGNTYGAGMVAVDRFQKKSRRAAAGIFHQHASRNIEGFDGRPIHALHLVCRYQVHLVLLEAFSTAQTRINWKQQFMKFLDP